MAVRRPLVNVGGQLRELPAGDTLQDVALWYFGTGSPSDAGGVPGDYYVASDNNLWKKGATTWTYTGVQFGSSAAVPEKTTPVDADVLTLGDSTNGGQMRKLSWLNLRTSLSFRLRLAAARTYYVRVDGNNGNTGLVNSAGGAFSTIQKAIDVASVLDNGGFDVTIAIEAGIFTSGNILRTIIGSGRIIVRGINDNISDTIVSTAGVPCFDCGTGFSGTYHLRYMRLEKTGAEATISGRGGGGIVLWDNLDFGPNLAGTHIQCGANQSFRAEGNYTISGGAGSHIGAYDGGHVRVQSKTVTLTGTPAFSGVFVVASRCGQALLTGDTWVGSATGNRYSASLNGVLLTGTGSETYLPGSAAGSKDTGGQYT